MALDLFGIRPVGPREFDKVTFYLMGPDDGAAGDAANYWTCVRRAVVAALALALGPSPPRPRRDVYVRKTYPTINPEG